MAEIPHYLALGLRLPSAASPFPSGETGSFAPGNYLPELLSESIDALSPQDHQRLIEHYGRAQLDALLALQGESVPALFFQGLLHLGRNLAETGREGAAWRVFRLLETKATIPELASQARESRNLLEGKGSFGAQTENSLRGFFKEVTDFRTMGPTLAGAFLGSMFYNFSRFKVAQRIFRGISARPEVFPLDILKMRIQSRGLALLGGAAVSTLLEQGLHSLAGEAGLWTQENLARAYGDSLLSLFAWRFSVGLSDLYLGSALANHQANAIRKKIEAFLLTQAAAATCIGLAMAVSPYETPKSQPAIAAQLFHTLLGMNTGRLVGRRLSPQSSGR